MITANEFRLGNFVKNEDGELYKIVKLSFVYDKISFTAQSPIHRGCIEECEGEAIPLMHKILKDLGFRYFDDCDQGEMRIESEYSGETGLYSVEKLDGEIFVELRDIDGGTIGKPCYFVHQIQNLYFFLTGQELELIKFSI